MTRKLNGNEVASFTRCALLFAVAALVGHVAAYGADETPPP